MKIKIDNNGILFVERAGKMQVQICPFDLDSGNCGHWCPLFNEEFLHHPESPNLELCRTLYSHNLEVIDERPKE